MTTSPGTFSAVGALRVFLFAFLLASTAGYAAAPTVAIGQPADGALFNEGVSINFQGTASDPGEDGDLTASILWSSDQDGPLGVGGSIDVSTLSAGAHTITASVTDSGAESGSD